MFEIFHYSFMVRALLAGLLVAVCVPVLGSFLVSRRYSLIADSLAHVSLAGVGAGLLFGGTPILVAIPVTVAGALLIEYLRQNKRISGEISLAILMSGGLAVAIVLATLSSSGTDFNSYLFGSITTTQDQDVVALLIGVVIILGIIAWNYRSLVHISFNEDSARIAGINVTGLNYLLAAMTAIMVVFSMRIVGGLLISALLVIPVVAAGRLSRSFIWCMIIAIVLAVIAIVTGLLFAFYAGIAAGGAIVLSALALFVLALLLGR